MGVTSGSVLPARVSEVLARERDIIYAFRGVDFVWDQGGRDDVYGFDGGDTLRGGIGVVKVSGGDGSDHLLDGPLEGYSKDTVNGGNGRDYSETQNAPAYPDIVECGSGDDRARVDSEDIVSDDCETVQLIDENAVIVGSRTAPPSSKIAK